VCLRALVVALSITLATDGRGALTLVHREVFQGVGTITSANPGANLGTVTGTLYKRPGGPRVHSEVPGNAEGWSADVHNAAACNSWTIPYSSGFSGMACGWFFLGNYTTDKADRQLELISLSVPNTNILTSIMLNDSYQLAFHSSFDNTPATIAAPFNDWVFLAVAWVNNPTTGTTAARAYYQLPGGSLTQLGDETTVSGNLALTALLGEAAFTGNDSCQIRYGCPSLYTMSSFSDVVVPGDVGAPATTNLNWYVNPATGNDNNDGTSPAGAWQTVAKLNAESAYLGLFPTNGAAPGDASGTPAGNVLYIDCSGASLPVPATSLLIQTAGLTIKETQVAGTYGGTPTLGGHGIDPMTTMTANSWTATAGGSNVWQSTDGNATDLASTVLFEDGRYMNHPTGGSLGSVISSLSNTPGSFWTDGTTMYVHTFENGNPNTDGHAYRRTRNRDGVGNAAVQILAPNVWWDGFVCAGTTLASALTNDPINGTCIQWGGETGTSLLSNFNVNHYSKHGVGRTTGPNADGIGVTMVLNRQNGVYGQASPYVGFGGASADVDYSGNAADTNCTATYTNCSETVNSGLIGSTTGTISTNVLSYITHNSGTAFMSSLAFNNCHFVGELNDQGSCRQISFQNTTCFGTQLSSPATFDRCTTNGGLLASTAAPCLIRNCIMVCPYSGTNYYVSQLGANTTIVGSVFDLRATPANVGAGNDSRFGALYGKGPSRSSLTVENCLYLGTNIGFTSALTYGFTNSDTLTLNHNAYVSYGDAIKGSIAYNNSGPIAFSNWQAMGFEANDVVTANPLIIGYVPQSGSPLINAGLNLTTLPLAISTDFTGASFPYRTSIGAYEVNTHLTPQSLIGFPATASINVLAGSVTLPATTSAGLPITYTLIAGPARLNGYTLTITGTGPVVISASQPGNSTYARLDATEVLNVGPPGFDTPAMPPWAMLLFGALLALTAMRSLRLG